VLLGVANAELGLAGAEGGERGVPPARIALEAGLDALRFAAPRQRDLSSLFPLLGVRSYLKKTECVVGALSLLGRDVLTVSGGAGGREGDAGAVAAVLAVDKRNRRDATDYLFSGPPVVVLQKSALLDALRASIAELGARLLLKACMRGRGRYIAISAAGEATWAPGAPQRGAAGGAAALAIKFPLLNTLLSAWVASKSAEIVDASARELTREGGAFARCVGMALASVFGEVPPLGASQRLLLFPEPHGSPKELLPAAHVVASLPGDVASTLPLPQPPWRLLVAERAALERAAASAARVVGSGEERPRAPPPLIPAVVAVLRNGGALAAYVARLRRMGATREALEALDTAAGAGGVNEPRRLFGDEPALLFGRRVDAAEIKKWNAMRSAADAPL
jgi:hypothetical protein